MSVQDHSPSTWHSTIGVVWSTATKTLGLNMAWSSVAATQRSAGDGSAGRVISATWWDAALRWLPELGRGDGTEAEESTPLLKAPTPSTTRSSMMKPTSPPLYGPTTIASGQHMDRHQRKRLSGSQYEAHSSCAGPEDELCELVHSAGDAVYGKRASAMVRVGGWRLRLRDLLYVVAFVGGITTLGLIYPSHFTGHQSQAVRVDGTTANYAYDSESDDILTPRLSRDAALERLAHQLEVLKAHELRRSINGELNTTLRVGVKRFVDGPISFTTRAYDHSIPGPLWVVQPGDRINVQLVNELGENVPGKWTPNTYHDPNTTNLHVHGMHVDPTGTSDNIFRKGEPGQTLEYQYDVPTSHPRGLYHYHPHYHGSIFVQMAGGMVGGIMVEDDVTTLPLEYKHIKQHVAILQEFRFDGGLGSDLRQGNEAARSKLHVQPQYTAKVHLDAAVRSLFPDAHVGSQRTDIHLDPTVKWIKTRPDISRFYTMNGQYLPKIEVQPNENVLLRLLNAGVSAALELSIPGCSMHQIAADGIYFTGAPRPTELLIVSPGGRADVVINCQLNSDQLEPLRPFFSAQDASVDFFMGKKSDIYHGVLAFFHVSGASLERAPVSTIPPAPSLYSGSDLLSLSPADASTVEPFTFEFSMNNDKRKKDGFPYKDYFINRKSFTMESLRDMPLNQVQEWVIVNQRDEPLPGDQQGMMTYKNHPFHLHTNAFQIVAMTHGEGIDYRVGDWRDVIAVPTPGNVTIRFRPVDFKGAIVAHCHIAGHSDAGMVARVDIV